MKKRLKVSAMTVFFAMLLGIAVMSIGTEQAFAMAGNGTAENPYQISTYADLKQFAAIVNGANGETKNTAACAILTKDIDASSSGDWVPIGTNNDSYTGAFDGNEKTITNLSNGDSKAKEQGMFGGIGYGGTVKNVTLKNANIRGRSSVGGVAGKNYGTITNCHTAGKVSGKDGNYIGGVAGRNYGTIENCSNTGDVSVSQPHAYVGGVAGENFGTITNCSNIGAISGTHSIGGVAGGNNKTIENCYNTGAVTGNGTFVGGVAGGNNKTIENCYNTGTVTGDQEVGGVAGLIGVGTITNCYNTGAVSGNSDVGGVAGLNGEGTITNCYNTGAVSGDQGVGGIAGLNGEGTITNCYYDKEECSLPTAIAEQYGTAENVEGLETAEMTGTTCTAYDSWDNFYAVWKLTDSYPILGHDHVLKYEKEQSCEEPAHIEGYTCSFCGKHYSDEEGKNLIPDADWTITATGHDWQFDGFEWQQPGQVVHKDGIYATYSCKNDPEHQFKEHNSLIIKASRIEPTCEKDGGERFTAEINASDSKDGQYHKDKIEVIEPGTATGHKYGSWTKLNATQHQKVCEHDKSHVVKENHKWDAGKVTKKATEKATGVRTYTCTVCKATKTETIPKLKPTTPKTSGTPLAKATAKKNSLTIGWNKIQGAEGYDVFFALCNHGKKEIKCKKVKTIKGNKTFKWTKSGLKNGTAYKFYVRAYVTKNGKKTYVSKTPMFHAYTGNGTKNYTNAKSVTVNKTKVTLKKGKTFKIKAKVNKINKKKKLMPKSHAPTLRYMTTNKKVATVNSSGKITAKGKGTCTVIAFAHNGVSKSIKVTVK